MPKNLSTLNELLYCLSEAKESEYAGIARRIAITPDQFEVAATWSSEHYTRNCLARTKEYELLLLCWAEEQITPIHCHGGQECWVKMVKGSIKERRFKDNAGQPLQVQELVLPEGGISYMNDEMGYHSLENLSKGKAMSLHLYMNPIEECQIYDEDKKAFHWKTLQYHSIFERTEPAKLG